MATKEFVAVNWNPSQLVDEDTLDQMNNNINYLHDQMVDGLYQQRLGGTTDVGLKLLCGTASVATSKASSANVTVTFAKMFTPDSYPVITTGIVSAGARYVFLTTMGIGRLLPNHQGFVARLTVDNVGKATGFIGNPMYINWIAMGY